MAAQNKTTAVHFSLIFFVMLSVVLGVVAYLFYADYREQQANYTKGQQDLAARESANKRYLEEIEELKKAIGVEVPEVGVVNPGDATVLGQARSAIATFGTNPAIPSLVAALQNLRAAHDKQAVEIAERQATIDRLNGELTALRGQYDEIVKQHAGARQRTEQDLSGEQTKFAEQVAAKDVELTALRQQLNGVQTELEQTKEQLGNQITKLQGDIEQYVTINDKHRKELERVRGDSFEVADGEIVRVDQVARLVWINLGEKDGVKPRMTFSVYETANSGIGRDNPTGGRSEDIKGSIEVTRVVGAKLAEARILDDTSRKPIAPGDPIFTPLWSPGRTERFAFVGKLDIDGDGNYSDDRERLREIVKAAGAEIASEVTDEGERIPEGRTIDEQVRFLVIGTIPDLGDEADPDARERIKKMGEHHKAMDDEARRHGVRVISLSQFLDYIGFVPQRRLFVPGADAEWKLQAGSRSTGTSARPNSRGSSTGNTSSLFDNSRGRPNATSGGATSQVFGGRNGN